ncbi:hypothetical protein pipiens_003223 [Culex pipiens pipiens]|uniref:Secreted protein n=1 Tax=Culex pipiens pipiens TaxID=38569 RepID=A0ABD1D224_CULPP
MKVTFFLLLVAAVAFLAVFQPTVEAAPQDVATAEVAAPEARQEGSDGKPEGGAAADGPSTDGGKKGHGKGGKGGKFLLNPMLRRYLAHLATNTSEYSYDHGANFDRWFQRLDALFKQKVTNTKV